MALPAQTRASPTAADRDEMTDAPLIRMPIHPTDLVRAAFAEAVGTFALVFAGTGAVVEAQTGTLGHVGVALTFGLVVVAAIYAVGEVSSAHINPTITVAFWASGRFPGRRVGPYVLVQFAADLKWLSARGVTVERYNLAQQPDVFVRDSAVREAVNASDTGGLPLIVAEGRIAAHSRYPDRDGLARIAGLTDEVPLIGLDVVSSPVTGSCCGPDGGTSDSDCC